MLKIVSIITLVLGFANCNRPLPKDYLILSGTIANAHSDTLVIRSQSYEKKINIKKDGFFSDTLKVKEGLYNLYYGKESTKIFLSNGFNLTLKLDTNQFHNIVYSGIGKEVNNYLAKKPLIIDKLTYRKGGIYDMKKSDFNREVEGIFNSLTNLLEESKESIDSSFIDKEKIDLNDLKKDCTSYYEELHYVKEVLAKGKPSPKFFDFENYAGGTTSLDNLRGKYLYIDIWATWCVPCIKEIPSLKELEKKCQGKNIRFVSISIDNQKNKDKWKAMIANKDMEGVQLLADNEWNSKFIQDYKISSVPRFILIDPNGNIVSSKAPLPSDKEAIEKLFKSINIL